MNTIIRLRSLRSWIRGDKTIDLQSWRDWLVDIMAIFSLFAFPLGMAVSIPIFIGEKLYGLIAFDVAILVVLTIRLFTMGISYKKRGYFWLTLLHIMTIIFFISLGPHYARSGWLVMCTVMASVFFGIRAAAFSTGINAAMLMMLYWLMGHENPAWVAEYAAPFGKWMMFVVNISIISLASSLPVGLLLGRLDRSLGHERDAHKMIVQEREKLETAFRTLEVESFERKQAEDGLRESEKKYRLIAENMADVISVLDMNLHFTYVSPSIMRIRGFTVEEAMEQTLDQVMTPQSLKIALAAFEEEIKLEASGTADPDRIRTMELDEYRKDGSIIRVEASLSYLRDKDHKPVAILAAIRDITERKRAEECLWKSEEKYRNLFETVIDGVFIADGHGRFLEVNKSACQQLGYSRDELLRLSVLDISAITESGFRAFQEKINTERLLRYETTYRRKDGTIVPVELIVTGIQHEEQRALLGVARDITERKRADEEIMREREKLKTLSNNAPFGMVLINKEGHFTYINTKFIELFGFDLSDIPDGRTWFRKAYPDTEYRHTVISAWVENFRDAKPGEQKQKTFTVTCKDGTEKIVNFTTSILFSSDYLMTCEDTTTLRHVESQLRQAQKMEAIGTLAGGIAHDFNNILSAILGYAELASLDIEEGTKAKYHLEHSMKAAHRAKDLVQQILAFSRQGRQERKLLNIKPIVKEGLKFLRASLPTTIEIRPEIEEDVEAIEADPTEVHQVLMNLCTNAAHAMEEKGGELKVSLCNLDLDETSAVSGGVEPGPYVRLRVSDTGHGMAPEVLRRIYEPYFTTKEAGKGTGLGLAVVHGIVKSYGGGVTVSSKAGTGSTFDIYFPRVEAVDLPSEGYKVEPLPVGFHERVLFVDDEEGIVEVGREILEYLGYEVVVKTSSIEALESFRGQADQFDLVITDMTMPNMTGDKLAQELLKIRPGIPIILCTGFSEHMTAEKAKALGIRELAMKPLVMKELAKAMRRALEHEKR